MSNRHVRLLMASLILALLLSGLAAPGGGAPLSDGRQEPPGARTTVVALPDGPFGVSWSPSGQDLIYVLKDELRDWPRGRRLHLPKVSAFEGATGDHPPAVARWREDGKEVAVVLLGRTALAVDFERFTIQRTLPDTFPVWWSGHTLCYAPIKPELTPRGRQIWYYGSIRHRTPRGIYFSDVSQDGKVALTYLARRRKPREALMALDSLTGRLKLLCSFPAQRDDRYYRDYHYPDTVFMKWNSKLHAAAVLYTYSWAPAVGFQKAYFPNTKRSRDVAQAFPDYLVYADQPPEWRGDKVLAKERPFIEYEKESRHITEDWYQLVLWDPNKAAAQTLLKYGGERPEDLQELLLPEPLGVFALSPDGKRLAYSRVEPKEMAHKLTITDFDALLPK